MKKIISKITSLAIISTIILQFNVQVFALTQQDINELKDKKDSNNDKSSEVEEQKDKVEEQKDSTLKEIDKLTNEILQYEGQIFDLETKLENLNTEINNQEEELNKKEEEFKKQKELYEARLIAMYEQGETSYLEVILSADSITEMVSNYYLISELAKNDSEMMDNIEKQQQEIEKVKSDLETNKKKVVTSKSEIEGITTQLKSSKTEKNKYVAELSEEEKALQSQLDDYNTTSEKIEKEIAKMEKELQKQIEKEKEEEKAKENQNSSGNSSSNNSNNSNNGNSSYVAPTNGVLQKPVKTGYVSATWYYPSGRYHGAIDYALPTGNPIYAAADGIVVSTGNLSYGYGTYVVIRHTSIGLETWYGHGTKGSINVYVGQSVSRGDKIMLSGNTGNSTGPHVHFEARTAPYRTTNRVYPPNYY